MKSENLNKSGKISNKSDLALLGQHSLRSVSKEDLQNTVNLALCELGLPESFLISALALFGYKIPFTKNGSRNYGAMSLDVWIFLCELCHLDINSISTGYFRQMHVYHVGQAIREGRYLLPRTQRLESLYREHLLRKRDSIRWEANHLGHRLQQYTRRQRYVEAIETRKRRLTNLALHEQQRNLLTKLLQQTQMNINIQDERNSCPGLTMRPMPSKLNSFVCVAIQPSYDFLVSNRP